VVSSPSDGEDCRCGSLPWAADWWCTTSWGPCWSVSDICALANFSLLAAYMAPYLCVLNMYQSWVLGVGLASTVRGARRGAAVRRADPLSCRLPAAGHGAAGLRLRLIAN